MSEDDLKLLVYRIAKSQTYLAQMIASVREDMRHHEQSDGIAVI